MRKIAKLGLLLVTLSVALVLQTSHFASAATTDNWGNYSLMFSRSAGQFYSGNQVGGQWAWSPQSATTSDVSWGDPANWPPQYAEHFIKSGDWVMLDGYSSGPGQPVSQVQRVTTETQGNASCNNMTPIASNGKRQHYAKWNIPTSGYCLDATGTITSTANGTVVHFRHRQQWSAPAPCTNAYYTNRVCITQHEQWWDDNGHSYSKQLDRTQYLAKNLGMAFKIKQTFPSNWSAEGRYYWKW
jgi:hypothetical protein